MPSITIHNQQIEYVHKTRRATRRITLSVHPDGVLHVSTPVNIRAEMLEKLILQKSEWIMEKIEHFKKLGPSTFLSGGVKDYKNKKNDALTLVTKRLEYFNKHYCLKWNRVTVRNQTSRWGSCSKRGNLSFNYRIVYLPPHLSDYIVVHELCHLGQFNHSHKFWSLVEETVPDYKNIRTELKKSHIARG